MFSLAEFEPYVGQSLKGRDVLVWSEGAGYYFLPYEEARDSYLSGVDFKVIAVEV